MFEPRRLTTLWTFMACRRDSFIARAVRYKQRRITYLDSTVSMDMYYCWFEFHFSCGFNSRDKILTSLLPNNNRFLWTHCRNEQASIYRKQFIYDVMVVAGAHPAIHGLCSDWCGNLFGLHELLYGKPLCFIYIKPTENFIFQIVRFWRTFDHCD
jgi:hypothetical protein